MLLAETRSLTVGPLPWSLPHVGWSFLSDRSAPVTFEVAFPDNLKYTVAHSQAFGESLLPTLLIKF